MKPDDILSSLANCAPDSKYGQTCIQITLEVLRTSDELEALLAACEDSEGWIARQSGVDVFHDGAVREGKALGQVISGELVKGDKSLQIRRLPDRWIATILEENTGQTCLFDVVKHLTVRHGTAVYHRFWSLPDDGATEVTGWRFVRFEETSA